MKKFLWWLRGKCTVCGRRKFDWRGADACLVHGLVPGFSEDEADRMINEIKK